jgi:hypothetical protein
MRLPLMILGTVIVIACNLKFMMALAVASQFTMDNQQSNEMAALMIFWGICVVCGATIFEKARGISRPPPLPRR